MRRLPDHEPENEKKPAFFRMIRATVRLFSPKYTLYGTEKLPEDACVIIGNHCQMYGPIAAELYMPRRHATWCVGEMMDRKEVPAYAFRDFWSMKPKGQQWFFRLLSHAIAPLAEYIFNNAHTVPVYRDARIVTTFRRSVEGLKAGTDLVIFPESAKPYNAIVTQFQEHFADLARIYERKTGTAVCFVPMYIAPALKRITFGDPVHFRPEAPADEERKRICAALMEEITRLAVGLPEHTVVPYLNIPKKDYPLNTQCRGANSPAEKNTRKDGRIGA